MYTQDFYITEPVGNNAFSFEQRVNRKLFVPKLKKIQSFDEIKLLQNNPEKVTFEDYDFDDVLQTCYGLENIYETSLQHLSPTLSCQEREQATKNTPVYLVDNHNHVFYFWYQARSHGIISDNALLYHIDEHADTRDPWEYLMKPDSEDLQKVFDFTNFTLNVGNYIIPAQKEGLIWEVVQIRSEQALNKYLHTTSQKQPLSNFPLKGERASYSPVCDSISPLGRELREVSRGEKTSIILNLDLDFFQPELDYINYELKKRVILDIAKKADLITICTSPFFIDQERTIRVLKDLFTPSASQPQLLKT